MTDHDRFDAGIDLRLIDGKQFADLFLVQNCISAVDQIGSFPCSVGDIPVSEKVLGTRDDPAILQSFRISDAQSFDRFKI